MNSQNNAQSENKQNSSTLSTLTQEHATKSNAIEVPQISLPKGGGALKGIDEKFQVNPTNGTSSFSIPLPFSPNRNGFTPQLALSYNSGTGNSLFGIGWDLGFPAIQRRTDKKLPRYFDTNSIEDIPQEDSFMFSGVEELVPLLDFQNDDWTVREIPDANYIIRQYRPRIEGGFSRIERIYEKGNGYYWRVTSRDNITTFFGYSPECRIADPTDKTKVFQWLPEFSFDDKGSWVWYEYKDENLKNVENVVHERNRFNGNQLFTNKHLKRIKYGNKDAYYWDERKKNGEFVSPYKLNVPISETHFFELVLDYGEYGKIDNGKYTVKSYAHKEPNDWLVRKDPFSTCRSGFEMRTYRLCRRVLMFHDFKELGNEPTLVRSLDFEYDENIKNEQAIEVSYLTSISQKGYVKKAADTYSMKALPNMTFDYQSLDWNKVVKDVSKENLVHAPVGLSGNYQWVDLYNEGINGILTEQADGWFYKSNLGEDENHDVRFSQAKSVMSKPSFMGLANGVLQLQDLDGNGEKQIVVTSAGLQGYFDLNFENEREGGEWQPFKSFLKTINLDLHDPNIRMLDVNGDGKPEIVLSDLGAFWFWENEGKIGYDTPELATKPYDEELGAAIVFSDQTQRIFLADMSGDGMADIVRISNGEVCYWSNMGYGRFSAKVTMHNSPIFDTPDMFNPSYIQLADISGTGATDIIYFGKNKFNAYLNFSGNSWSKVEGIDPFFPTEQPNKITITDLLGNGTACIVWSSEMPAYSATPMRFINLMGGKKPHIMVSHENGFGKKTVVEYKSSTYYYLQDKQNGTPWVTKLAFPIQCVSKTIVTERVTNVRFTSQYSYHHGYYDHAEREFRGFGRVEQTDAEDFDVFEKTAASNVVTKEHHQPPVLIKTWFHTGAFMDKERIITHFKKEYWFERKDAAMQRLYPNVTENELPDAALLAAPILGNYDIHKLSAEQWREALRACKGMTLRQETFGLDAEKRIADEKQAKNYADTNTDFINFQQEVRKTELVPYSVATHNCEIQLLQERNDNRYAVFTVKESQAITYAYERNPEDPRIAHTLTLETDDLNNVLEAVSIVYPRNLDFVNAESVLIIDENDSVTTRKAKEKGRKGQLKNWITFTKNDFTNDIILPEDYHLRKGWQTRSYELTGLKPSKDIFSIEDLKEAFKKNLSLSDDKLALDYFKIGDGAKPEKRLIEHAKTKFFNDDLTDPLSDGRQAIRGINYEAYQLAYTRNLLNDIFKASPSSALIQVTDATMEEGKFLKENTNWWIKSGRAEFYETEKKSVNGKEAYVIKAGQTLKTLRDRFFAPVGYTDPFETHSKVFYDPLTLFMDRAEDALGNKTNVLEFNYRTLSPVRMQDVNDNISSVMVDELGMVKVAAIEGKSQIINGLQGQEADNIIGFTENTEGLELQTIQTFFNLANTTAPQICNTDALQQAARILLGNASVRMVYDFSKQPTVVASIAREQHAKQNSKNSPLQISFEYSDGFGKVAMKKMQAESGKVKKPDGTSVDTGTQLRWVGNGRAVLNNKGNPIKQYEPYFSTTPAYENDPAWVERGVTPTIYYDGAGRNVKTELPNGTFTKVVFDAWKQLHFDVNDTVLESEWYKKRIRLEQPFTASDKAVAQKAAAHYNTPSCIVTDSLGRPTLGIDFPLTPQVGIGGQTPPLGTGGHYTTSEIDIEGNALSVTDARGNVVMQYRYDILGHRIAQTSMDAGKRWMLNNALGNPVKTWDERGHEFSFEYDVLHRPIKSFLKEKGNAAPILIETTEYGQGQNNVKANNLIGQVVRHRDGSGQITNVRFDIKGNLLKTQKQMPLDAKTPVVDWTNAQLDPVVYTLMTEYDALNRMTRLFNWHFEGSNMQSRVAVYLPQYSRRGVLESEEMVVNAIKTLNGFVGGTKTTVVKDILYDEKGQRMRMRYGNGTTTCYHYDELTFRLMQLRTTKQNNDPCTPSVKSNLTDPNVLQNLFYTYDPTGNITEIVDDAYKPVFFNGQKVLPQSTYTYDALYRLTEATGREQQQLSSPTQKDNDWQPQNFPIADTTLRGYTEQYQYDAVGNILKMRHIADNGSWTRNYQYATDSNRLLATENGSALVYDTYTNAPTLADRYTYDAHGSITRLGNVAGDRATWDYRDMIQSYDLVGGGNAAYQYSGSKERSRKHISKNGAMVEERLYLGGLERYRRWQNDVLLEEIETLHVFDGQQRILIAENVLLTPPSGGQGGLLFRYQYSNHLGSAALELDEHGAVISYEEYHPYGTSAYQAHNAAIKTTAKRYRYTGMERDEETGLAYHSARYYLPWLGRWCSCDPIGIGDWVNVYGYVHGNPLRGVDLKGTDDSSSKKDMIDGGVAPTPTGGAVFEYEGTKSEHIKEKEVQDSNEKREEPKKVIPAKKLPTVVKIPPPAPPFSVPAPPLLVPTKQDKSTPNRTYISPIFGLSLFVMANVLIIGKASEAIADVSAGIGIGIKKIGGFQPQFPQSSTTNPNFFTHDTLPNEISNTFESLEKERLGLGLPPAGSDTDKSTLAKFISPQGESMGSNGRTGGRPFEEREAIRIMIKEIYSKAPGQTAMGHAEADALLDAYNKGLTGENGVLVVDRRMCGFCNSSLKNILQFLHIETLTIYSKVGDIYVRTVINAI